MLSSEVYNQYNMSKDNYGIGNLNYYHLINSYLSVDMNDHMSDINKISLSKNKIKTSLCKKWTQSGHCPYGNKCQFAHGIAELRCNVDENSYKTKPCNAFFKKSYCPYGDRCNFSHDSSRFSLQEKQNAVLKQSNKYVGYQQILNQAKFSKEGTSLLMKSLNYNIQQGDNKSIGSTQDCNSSCLSSSIISGHKCQIEFDSFYNFTAQSLTEVKNQGCFLNEIHQIQQGLKLQKFQVEAPLIFNIDQFY